MKHWKPDEAIARTSEARRPKPWPAGATAGPLLIAVGCVGMAALLYRLAGPRDVFPG